MSEDFILNYFNFINSDRQQLVLPWKSTIYLAISSSGKYLKDAIYQHFQIVENQIYIAIQLLVSTVQCFAMRSTRQQQIFRTYSR